MPPSLLPSPTPVANPFLVFLLHLPLNHQSLNLLITHPSPHTIHNPLKRLPTGQNPLQITTVHPTPMIRHPPLREIIRPDLILPPRPRHTPHRTPPQPNDLFFPRLASQDRDLRAQEPPRAVAVLMLAALFLDEDDGVGGQVGQADGGLGLVDVLAAGAGGAHGLGFDVGGVEVVVAVGVVDVCAVTAGGGRVRETGQDEDGDGAGVCAAFAFCGGDALDAVHACFGAERVVGAWGVDFEERVGQAGFVGAVVGGVACEAGGPALARAEVGVHGEQGVGEQGGFAAAGAGVDLDHARHGRERVGGDQTVLQPRRDAGE